MKKTVILLGAAVTSLAMAAPAQATWFTHSHYCKCGHSQGSKLCGSTSSGGTTTTSGGTTTTTTSGGTTTSSGGSTTSGGTTTSGGSTSTSGGTAVPEPGVLGLFGLGLLGLGLARRRRQR